jgi:hypothetical protein
VFHRRQNDSSHHGRGLTADGDRFLAVIIICPAIAVIASALRMWCKVVTMKSGFQSFHADDWAILGTTVTYLAAASPIFWGKFSLFLFPELNDVLIN